MPSRTNSIIIGVAVVIVIIAAVASFFIFFDDDNDTGVKYNYTVELRDSYTDGGGNEYYPAEDGNEFAVVTFAFANYDAGGDGKLSTTIADMSPTVTVGGVVYYATEIDEQNYPSDIKKGYQVYVTYIFEIPEGYSAGDVDASVSYYRDSVEFRYDPDYSFEIPETEEE